ncbi:MAG: DUF3108 domain-containing protein [Pseudomonadota bacterium]
MLPRPTRWRRLLATALLCACLAPAWAVRDELAPFEASYRVYYKGSKAGEASLSLAQRDGHWQVQLKTRATGLFRLFSRYINSQEISRFLTAEDGAILPRHYRYERPGQKDGRRLLRIEFVDNALDVVRDIGEPTRYETPDSGAWDRLSMLFNVTQLVGERSEGDVMLNVVSRHGPSQRRLELLGRETVSTPAGDFNALHLRYHSGKRTVQYWIATADGNIPVRMMYGEDGEDGGVLELTSLQR